MYYLFWSKPGEIQPSEPEIEAKGWVLINARETYDEICDCIIKCQTEEVKKYKGGLFMVIKGDRYDVNVDCSVAIQFLRAPNST